MMTNIALAKAFIMSYSYQSYVVKRIFKTCSLKNFQAYITELLAIIIMLNIRPQNLFILQLKAGILYPTSSHFPYPSPWKPELNCL